MQLRVLGCQGPYPGPGGATSGYLLSHGDTEVLIDCGSGVLARLWEHMQPRQLSTVVISHLHADHIADLLVFRYQLPDLLGQGMESLPVYAPEEPATEYILLSQGSFDLRLPVPGERFPVGGLQMTCAPMRHPVPSFAYRFEAEGRVFVYSGDTNTTPELAAFARGAHLLLVDAAFTDAQWQHDKPHLSARLAAEAAREAGVERLVLTHFAPDADVEALRGEAMEFFPRVEVAAQGAQWTV